MTVNSSENSTERAKRSGIVIQTYRKSLPAFAGMAALLMIALSGGCRVTSLGEQARCAAIRQGEPQVELVALEQPGMGCRNEDHTPGDYVRSIMWGGRARRYEIHVPPGYRADPLPVVIVYHGGGSQPAMVRAQTRMDDTADDHGFIVLYPYGTGPLGPTNLLTWNAGGGAIEYAWEHRIDDVGFTRAMLTDVARHFCIDTRRVYATGISNGAQMAYRVACELSDRIAAIAPVAATMPVIDCQPVRPVPVLHFHGTDDEYAPYEGGVGPRGYTNFDHLSVADNIEFWRAVNGCDSQQVSTWQIDDAELFAYTACDAGSTVELVTLHGGGHTWPGGSVVCDNALGEVNRDVSASEMMWEFFEAHPMPEVP
jgi:polyhydroxybutyrate depolymerase